MQILELDPILDTTPSDEVELLHLFCSGCARERNDSRTLCGVVDEKDLIDGMECQECETCFDYFERGVCPRAHLLSRKL